jgi:hypothetical protein
MPTNPKDLPDGHTAVPPSSTPPDKRRWRVAPALAGRGLPGQRKPRAPHRMRGFWVFVVVVLALNWISVLVARPGTQPRVTVPFGPYFMDELLLGFGPTLLFVGLFWFLSRRAGGMGALGGFGRSKARRVDPTGIRVTFDDVAGIDDVKAELSEIVDFLRSPQRYERLGGRMPDGVLLFGPPGTGKTLLARAVAGEAPSAAFFSIAASEFIEAIVGVGAARVRDLFAKAKEAGLAIIFIDELDAIGRSRQGSTAFGGSNDEREQTLDQILTEMDGFESNQAVVVLAATNRPEVLDPALLAARRDHAKGRMADFTARGPGHRARSRRRRTICARPARHRFARASAASQGGRKWRHPHRPHGRGDVRRGRKLRRAGGRRARHRRITDHPLTHRGAGHQTGPLPIPAACLQPEHVRASGVRLYGSRGDHGHRHGRQVRAAGLLPCAANGFAVLERFLTPTRPERLGQAHPRQPTGRAGHGHGSAYPKLESGRLPIRDPPVPARRDHVLDSRRRQKLRDNRLRYRDAVNDRLTSVAAQRPHQN